MTKYPSNFQLFAAPDGADTVQEAKYYVMKNGLKDDVRIVKKDGWVYVVVK